MIKNAFLTGSRKYGIPKDDSDIDVAVLVDTSLKNFLFSQSEDKGGSVRFGKLNLILLDSPKEFMVWREATNTLNEQSPVSREFAIDFIKRKLALNGCGIQEGIS
jgi:predicted nucleotidyltransferase